MRASESKLRAQMISTFANQGGCPGQEDHILTDQEKGVFVVADGFGGPVPGAQAAKSACEAVRSFLFKEAGDRDATLPFVLRTYFSLAGNVLFNSLIFANRKVMSLNTNKNVHEKGGASVLAAFVDGDLLAIANVGNCAARLYRKGQCVDLVVPRTYGRLRDPFSVHSETRSPGDQAPLMALGMSEDLEPEIFEYKIQRRDWIVLATDGISVDVLDKIAGLQKQIGSLQTSYEQIQKDFLSLVKQSKFTDNATLSLIVF